MKEPATFESVARLQELFEAELKELAQKHGRGPGGRELAVAITHTETARLFLHESARVVG